VIRVFIVGASSLARGGLQNLLADRGVEVARSVADLDSLAGLFPDTDADALVIDASGENPESMLDSLARSDFATEIPVVLLVGNQWPADALNAESQSASRDAFRSGVRAVLPADVTSSQLFAALQAVTAGLLVMHPAEMDTLAPAASPASQPLSELAEPLTRREREVLQMLAAGLGNKEIAVRLNISDHTAKFHVGSILGKLGAASRTEAVALGIRRGLVLL
jgi:two-component system, NarL family, response regulator YdfI